MKKLLIPIILCAASAAAAAFPAVGANLDFPSPSSARYLADLAKQAQVIRYNDGSSEWHFAEYAARFGMEGTYHLRYRGNSPVKNAHCAVAIANLRYDPDTDTTDADVQCPWPGFSEGANGLILAFDKPVSGVHLYAPGVNIDHPTIASPSFLAFCRDGNVGVLRYGDARRMNWDLVKAFTQRTKPEDETWSTIDGLPWEAVVWISNETHTNPWICLPPRSGPDTWEGAAEILKGLAPGLKVVVQFGNEPDNMDGPYRTYFVLLEEAQATTDPRFLQGDNARDVGNRVWSIHGDKIGRIHEVFAAKLGEDRVLMALPFLLRRETRNWAAQTDNFVNRYYGPGVIKVFAVGPYYTPVGIPPNPTAEQVNDACYAGAAYANVVDGVPLATLVREAKAFADGRGKRLMAYEKGLTMLGTGLGQAVLVESQRLPSAARHTARALDTWRDLTGGAPFCYYQPSVSFPGSGGYALSDSYEQLTAPKLAAFMAWGKALAPVVAADPVQDALRDVEAAVAKLRAAVAAAAPATQPAPPTNTRTLANGADLASLLPFKAGETIEAAVAGGNYTLSRKLENFPAFTLAGKGGTLHYTGQQTDYAAAVSCAGATITDLDIVNDAAKPDGEKTSGLFIVTGNGNTLRNLRSRGFTETIIVNADDNVFEGISSTDLRGFGIFGGGNRNKVKGCVFTNSTRECAIRLENAHGWTIDDSVFEDEDRRATGDNKDYAKSSIRAEWCSDCTFNRCKAFLYLTDDKGNRVPGDVSNPVKVGPLGGNDGRGLPEERCAVTFNDCELGFTKVEAGTDSAVFDHCTFRMGGAERGFIIDGYDKKFERTVKGVAVRNCLFTSTSTYARVLRLEAAGAENIVFENNIVVAPNMVSTGGEDKLQVVVNPPPPWPLSIKGNVFQDPPKFDPGKPVARLEQTWPDPARFLQQFPGNTFEALTEAQAKARGAGVR